MHFEFWTKIRFVVMRDFLLQDDCDKIHDFKVYLRNFRLFGCTPRPHPQINCGTCIIYTQQLSSGESAASRNNHCLLLLQSKCSALFVACTAISRHDSMMKNEETRQEEWEKIELETSLPYPCFSLRNFLIDHWDD